MINVHIISGFLGAGKTTLIKKLINLIDDKKVIIENEFGDIGIDGEIMKRENYEVIELAKGCICCSLKEDFKNTLWSVIEDYKPKSIIIEPTGIGKLSDILYELKDKKIMDKCILTTPITVVDALDYLDQVNEFGGFFKDQIRNAGIVVLSKTQLMEKGNLSGIIQSIRSINPSAIIIADEWESFTEIEYNMLINTQYDSDKKIIRFIDKLRDINRSFQSFSMESPGEFSRKALTNLLDNLSDESMGRVIRAKGFVQGEDGELEFNYVNGKYSIDKNKMYNSSRICIIGSSLNKSAISRLLSNCQYT